MRPTRIISDTVITSSVTGAANAAQNMNANSDCLYEDELSWIGGNIELDAAATTAEVIGFIDLHPEDLADQLIVAADLFGFCDNQDTSAVNLRFSILAVPLTEDPESSSSGLQSGNYSPRTGLTTDADQYSGSSIVDGIASDTPFLFSSNHAFTPVATANYERGIWHYEWKMCIALAKVLDFATNDTVWRQIHHGTFTYADNGSPTSTAETGTRTEALGWSRGKFNDGVRLVIVFRKAANVATRVVCSGGIIRTIPEVNRPDSLSGSIL